MSVASPPRGSRAIDRAAALLVAVVEADEGRALGELSAQEGLPRSTTARLAAALERRGLVQREADGRLRPGPVLVAYASRGASDADLAVLAQGSLVRLSELSGETSNLVVPRPDGSACVAQVDGRFLLGGTNWVGRQVPHHASAAGKPFLAWGAVPLPEGRLARLAPRTITSRAALARELERVRATGWAAAVDELEAGLAAVGAPVRAPGGAVIAALTLSGPTVRIGDDRLDELGALVAAEAAALSARLGAGDGKEVRG